MSEYWLAAEMARRPEVSPTALLGRDISEEERREWEEEQERARGIETRERRRGVALGRGRAGGGILGYLLGAAGVGAAGLTGGLSLVIPALAAGLGSYAGQKVATTRKWQPPSQTGIKISPGAMKTFERIAPGRYYVGRGEEREREFEWGETERGRIMEEQILSSALVDALSGYGAAKYGGSILDMILGRGGAAAAPAAGRIAAPGWGQGYEWAAPWTPSTVGIERI